MSDSRDHISAVLRECEETLRMLATQGRLPGYALHAFRDLATRVRQEVERRQQADRRLTRRSSPDRRVAGDEPTTVDHGPGTRHP